MRVLVTGGLGLVGRSVVAQLVENGFAVRVFENQAAGGLVRIRHLLPRGLRGRLSRAAELTRGDLCNIADVGEAVRDVDAVIHLGALIPPLADRRPVYAHYVNCGGTANLVAAMAAHAPDARLVFSSSVAIYGDRRAQPMIRVTDPPHPGEDDGYARQKLEAESIVRASALRWTIFRLSYIVSPEKLRMDPLMFRMPLDTSIEVCTVADSARAIVRALREPTCEGRVLHLAGGPACRTTFREYLDRMTAIFGLGRGFFPEEAFSTGDFHCGFMDTDESQSLLDYQRETLEDYYRSVASAVRFRSLVIRVVRPLARAILLPRSPFWRAAREPEAQAASERAAGRRLGRRDWRLPWVALFRRPHPAP